MRLYYCSEILFRATSLKYVSKITSCDEIAQLRHRIIISARRNTFDNIMAGELSTIIVHHGIYVRFNSRNFYFQDANGISLKVSPSPSLSVSSFIIRIVTLAYFISPTSTHFSPLEESAFFYRFRTLLLTLTPSPFLPLVVLSLGSVKLSSRRR